MLSCIANNAAAAGQKATRGILIFSATSRAHPRFSSAITLVILLPPNPLIVFISSSSFMGMTCNIVSVNLPRSFLSSPGFMPSGSETRNVISNLCLAKHREISNMGITWPCAG